MTLAANKYEKQVATELAKCEEVETAGPKRLWTRPAGATEEPETVAEEKALKPLCNISVLLS